MGKIYERPKLVIIGVDNIDVITSSPAEDAIISSKIRGTRGT